jgi:hypothetical protein
MDWLFQNKTCVWEFAFTLGSSWNYSNLSKNW